MLSASGTMLALFSIFSTFFTPADFETPSCSLSFVRNSGIDGRVAVAVAE